MSEIHFSNFRLEENTEYFLYIGELKNYGLNIYLREALSRAFNRKFDFIAIVPDVFEQYNYDNMIVINPLANDHATRHGLNLNCRISAEEFMAAASGSRRIVSLVKRLLNRQERVYIYMYESLPQMTLDEIAGVSILGPDKRIANRVNNKIYQYENLDGMVPMVDFRLCRGMDELRRTTDTLWWTWGDGIFVSREYSAAGVNSIIARSPRDITEKFADVDAPYLISRYMPHEHDPTVLAVVADEDDVYVAGVADQQIENGTRFVGSRFPTALDDGVVSELKRHTRTLGKWLAGEGYRGIFGCDFIVGADNDIRFLEINARKQGTTLEFCCTLEQSLPPGSPLLPELEFYAVTEGLLPADAREMESNTKNLHWGTYNYKVHDPVFTEGYIPQDVEERAAFARVGDGRLKKDFLILEHAGSDFIIAEGSFIGRIVALGHDHRGVAQGLGQGRKTIELTIAGNTILEKENGEYRIRRAVAG